MFRMSILFLILGHNCLFLELNSVKACATQRHNGCKDTTFVWIIIE